jgi:isopenicillin N synthase-like dioxygenase
MSTSPTLPVIDISRIRGPDRDAFLADLRGAAHEVGFFYVTGHGILAESRRSVLESDRAFFALPEAARLEIENVNSPQFRGYTRTGTGTPRARPTGASRSTSAPSGPR